MKKFLLLSVAIFCGVSVVQAADIPVDRPDLAILAAQNPLNAKRLYREAWNSDRGIQLSTIDQLEYIQRNNPGFDGDTMEVVRRGSALMKKMKFGLEEADLERDAASIRQDSSQILTKLSQDAKTDATVSDAFAATDIIEPSERLIEKVYREEGIDRPNYHINLDAF